MLESAFFSQNLPQIAGDLCKMLPRVDVSGVRYQFRVLVVEFFRGGFRLKWQVTVCGTLSAVPRYLFFCAPSLVYHEVCLPELVMRWSDEQLD
jgi:hypothetical protein